LKAVALIPARGGSKRIPGKNIVDLVGKPLIAWTIEAALGCKLIEEVWVSTDCPEIAEVAKAFGASVHDRPKELASDTATSESALLEFAKSQATSFDALVFMQATSPLTQPEHLTQGVKCVSDGEADSCLAVSEDVRFYWDTNRTPINYDLAHRPRTQDKERWYKETGAWYITRKECLLKSGCRLSGKIEFVVVPERYSHEIDTYDDLEFISRYIQDGV